MSARRCVGEGSSAIVPVQFGVNNSLMRQNASLLTCVHMSMSLARVWCGCRASTSASSPKVVSHQQQKPKRLSPVITSSSRASYISSRSSRSSRSERMCASLMAHRLRSNVDVGRACRESLTLRARPFGAQPAANQCIRATAKVSRAKLQERRS